MSLLNAARLALHMLKGNVRAHLPHATRMSLAAYARLRQAELGQDAVVPIRRIKGPTVLVLAPHPDDEIIGCGGALHKHCLAGDDVTCVYVTDGEASGGGAPSIRRQIGGCRQREARSGADIIGVKKLVFLHQANEDVQPTGELVQRITELVATTRPDVVYLPFFLERHPDHFATNEVLMQAYLQASPRMEFYCCAYETVDPMPRPNCVVDIGDSVSKKAQALRVHETALRSMNIVDPTLGLNMHRALHIPGGKGYAEAFVYTPATEYFRLFQATFANA